MRRSLLFAVCILLISVTSFAQQPMIRIYFDEGLSQTAADCPFAPPGTVLDEGYVVAEGFNSWISAIEYRLDFPDEILWLADEVGPTALRLGNSPDGIAIAFMVPANAFERVIVQKVHFVWMCDGCYRRSVPWQVVAYPVWNRKGAIRWPDEVYINAWGMKSYICPGTPVEETTWGRVKALYR